MNQYDKKYYSKQFDQYRFNSERQKIFTYHLNNILNLKPHTSNLLDYGCGFGYFLGICDKAGIKTYGIELSDYAIKQARRFTGALISNYSNLPYPPNFPNNFDAITAFDLLEHVSDDLAILTWIYNHLKPHGLFYATTPNQDYFPRRFTKDVDPTHINVQSGKYWKNMLQKLGFRSVKVKYIFSFGFPPSTALRRKLKINYINPFYLPISFISAEILLIARK